MSMEWQGTAAGIELEPIALALSRDDVPDRRYYGMAVSNQGLIAYTQSPKDPPFLRILSASGRRMAAFGTGGDGPGEMRAPSVIAWRDELLIVVTRPGGVIAEFDSTGHLVREVATGFTGVVLGASPREFDGTLLSPRGAAKEVELRLMHGDLSRVPNVRPPADWPEIDRLLAMHLIDRTGAVLQDGFGYGRGSDYVIVGSGATYSGIVIPSLAGEEAWEFSRDLGPRYRGPAEIERILRLMDSQSPVQGPKGQTIELPSGEPLRARLKGEPVPHFGGGRSLFLDAKRRLWVLGTSDDRTFADVFRQGEFLGRLSIGCVLPRDGVSLAGDWLALRCEQEVGTETLHLFRIHG